MPDERRLGLETELRHSVLHKVRRGLRLWWRGEASLRRVVNAGLCNLSLRWRLARVLGKPYFLMIEPTNACNLRCPLCPTGRGTLGRKTTFLSLGVYRKCIDELAPYLIEVNVSNYGEPMMHRDLPEMIAYAKATGSRVAIGCNAHFLNEESSRKLIESGLDQVYISFDGLDQETYEKYRVRGDFRRVVEGVKALLAQRTALHRTNPFVELQFLVMKHNEGQIDAFRAMADEIGADRRIIKPVSFNVADWDDPDTRKAYGEFFPDTEDYRVYRHEGGEWHWKKEQLAFCTAPWRSLTVLADGGIVPCCRDPRGHYTMGNVADGVLKAWNGARFRAFRKSMVERRDRMPICKVCPGE
jgi:radical SAM protein with 4Fe4S-binding SPASM domain